MKKQTVEKISAVKEASISRYIVPTLAGATLGAAGGALIAPKSHRAEGALAGGIAGGFLGASLKLPNGIKSQRYTKPGSSPLSEEFSKIISDISDESIVEDATELLSRADAAMKKYKVDMDAIERSIPPGGSWFDSPIVKGKQPIPFKPHLWLVKDSAARDLMGKTAKAGEQNPIVEKEVTASLLRFELEKVAFMEDFIEKMAQLELAYQKGEISDKEKEAGIALLRGAMGALKGGVSAAKKALPGLKKTYQEAALHGARQAGSAGASPMGQKLRGVLEGSKWVAADLPGVAKQVGQAASTRGGRAYNLAVRQAARKSARAGASSAGQKLLGTAALAGGAGAAGGYMMGKPQQPTGY